MVYITSSVFAAILISIATQYWALQPILERTRERNVDAAIENLVQLVSQSLWVFNEPAAIDAAEAILRDQFISGILVNDHAELFQFRAGDLADTEHLNPQIEEIFRREDDDALTVVVPLIIRSQGDDSRNFNIGSLQLRSDNQLIKQQVDELARVTLIASIVTIFALQLIIYLLVRHTVAKPLELFTEHVSKYASNIKDNTQIEVPELANRIDEIGRLYSTFNQQRNDLVQRDRSLADYQSSLEQTVVERTTELRETNGTLLESLDQLKKAQAELIQNEKLVSLGTLVSGIAHEVNTPLGIAITASSHLSEELKLTRGLLDDQKLTKSGFENFLNECDETEKLLTNNLMRAAKLIQSFKKVAVDQSSDEERQFNLKQYLDEIVLSLRPKLKQTQLTIVNEVPDNIMLTTAPGAVAQITTNLIMNSIIHGFKNGTMPGKITFSTLLGDDTVDLIYEDNGVGMDEDTLKHIYDPFFTTRRSEGGSGLGMNIVYNLVTSKLNGYIETKSQPGYGLKVTMTIKTRQ